ncbi:MAG: ABC transporter permease [Planctomycetaceae bacterium]|nr:ABC transporter permease [Planctomycetaceae bacterium]
MIFRRRKPAADARETFKVLTYRQLMWRRFKRHKLAMAGAIMLVVLYTLALLADFVAPYGPTQRVPGYISAPPQRIHMWGPDGFHLRPFVYALDLKVDTGGFQRIYSENTSRMLPIRGLVGGHLFGIDPAAPGEPAATLFLCGSDRLGRDMLSRVVHGARVTLSIGLVGMSLSFVLGCVLGSVSGYYGGVVDTIIQRVIEFIVSIPTLPLWMALSAALPAGWPMYQRYFGITLILSLVGWCGLARVVRGQILQLRDQDFVTAARCASASDRWIIFRHLLPSTMSYLIVSITLAIPGMILGETALSFLGLGIQAPAVSWGTLLQDAQNIRTLANQPWVLIPGAFVVLTVISFNFVGDGLRDAVDPHGK